MTQPAPLAPKLRRAVWKRPTHRCVMPVIAVHPPHEWPVAGPIPQRGPEPQYPNCFNGFAHAQVLLACRRDCIIAATTSALSHARWKLSTPISVDAGNRRSRFRFLSRQHLSRQSDAPQPLILRVRRLAEPKAVTADLLARAHGFTGCAPGDWSHFRHLPISPP
jgi:hypothetical protein